jgi:hypothetical protein
MRYDVARSEEAPFDWVASAVNDEGDGEIYVAVFSGPRAKERAAEYAEWMNSRLAPPRASAAR